MIEATLDKSEKNQGLYDFLKEIAAYFDITDEKHYQKSLKSRLEML